MCSQFLTGKEVCAFQNPFNNIYMLFAHYEQVKNKYADCKICQYKLTCHLLITTKTTTYLALINI